MVFDGNAVEPDIMARRAVPPPEWEDAPLPFLVVEVLSGATKRRDHVQKRALYLDAGVPEYWIVDGEHRTIRVVRPQHDDEIVAETLRWHLAGAGSPLFWTLPTCFARRSARASRWESSCAWPR